MGTQVMIDARTRKVRASLDAPGEGTTIFAVDLIGDTWDDFGYFAEQAARLEGSRDLRLRNRYLRAAIVALFSHLDGVVSELFDVLMKESVFRAYLPKRPDFCSLKAKISVVATFLLRERAISLPNIDLNMKLLRDIVNHPSVTKEAGSAGSKDTLVYDIADVYGIGIGDLSATARAVDQWLSAACGAAGYERFRDTRDLCDDFTHALTRTGGSVREF
jgi:hypothetical protein